MKLDTKRNWKSGAWQTGLLIAMLSAAYASAGPGNHPGGQHSRIYGYKFNDLDRNGIDDNEPRVAGVTILLNGLEDTSVSDSTATDASGRFRFDGIPFQRYSICEVAVPPMTPTTPECVEVEIWPKNPFAQVVFGNSLPGPSPSPSPSPSTSPSPGPSPSPSPSPSPTGCARTQGFWGSSPAGQALVPILVPSGMSLGSNVYSAAQLDDILDEPTTGNALLILAHQLIAAKLNILAGADSSCVADAITQADNLIGTRLIPPVGTSFV